MEETKLNAQEPIENPQDQNLEDGQDQQGAGDVQGVEFEIDEHIENAMSKFGITEEDFQKLDPEVAKKTYNVLKSYAHAEKKMHEVTQQTPQQQLLNQQQLPNQQPIQQPVQQQNDSQLPEDFDPYDPKQFATVVQNAAQKAIEPMIQQLVMQQQIQQIVTDFKSRHPEVPESLIPILADVAVKHGFGNLDDAYNFMKPAFGAQQQQQPQQTGGARKIVIPTRPTNSGGVPSGDGGDEVPDSQKDVFDYLKKRY